MLSLTTLALVALCQADAAPTPQRRYSAEFQRGVSALAAGEREVAAGAFRAAGALAPDAPLWRLYLAAAQGIEAAPLEPVPAAGGAWGLVSDEEYGWPRFCPAGDFMLTGSAKVCIWDAASGARISGVSLSKDTRDLCWWSPERSGRYLFGTRIARNDFDRLEALEVRHLATGEPACAPLHIGQRVAKGTIMRWSDEPFDSARAVDDGPWFLVRRVALDGGTLTAYIPRRNSIDDPNQRAEVRADCQRALLTHVDHRSGSQRSTSLLVALDDPEPLVTLTAEWVDATFSHDGALVLTGEWVGPVEVYDAETGARLAVPTELQPQEDLEGTRRIPVVAHAGTLLVATPERVRTWDARAGKWVAELRLTPSLTERPWPVEETPSLCVLERARVLAFRSYREIAVYDADSGARLWSRRVRGVMWQDGGWHESAAGSWIMLAGPDGVPFVVDARTGALAVPLRVGATATSSIAPFAYDVTVAGTSAQETETRQGALVVAADGTLRTFELHTGAQLGRAELHRGREVLGMHVGVTGEAAAVPAAVTSDEMGRVALLELPSLELRALFAVEPGGTVRAASVGAGAVVLTRTEIDGATPVELRRIEGGALIASVQVASFASAELSDDGLRVALVGSRELLVLDVRTGEVQARVALVDPPLGKYEGACAFHGPSHFALAWGSDDFMNGIPGVGLDVYDLSTGALAGRHRAGGSGIESFGGWVGAIESMPDLGRLAYSVSASGVVCLLDDSDWRPVAGLDFNGGNPSTLELSHTPGSEWLCISGMTGSYSRVVGARALELRAKNEVEGLFGLCESECGRYVVGRSAGRVHVLNGASLEPLYERQELTGPGSRLVRAGKLVDLGVGPTATEDCHIERNGSSHPLVCFDAWLADPLGLAEATLERLPQPPRIDSGPARTVRSNVASMTLRLRAQDELGLLGVWVVAAGRAPRFLPVDAAEPSLSSVHDLTVEVDGPWPLDVELVAVGRTGLESKPWRVRIDAAR